MNKLKVLNALDELKSNDDKIVVVARAIRRVGDDVFVKSFPSKYGIQIIRESWGVCLISPPTIARKDNNCWAVIEQMSLWKRWFRLIGAKPTRSEGQRLLIETVHHMASQLPFVPNPIETHPMVDALTSIFESDDNMSHIDHSISLEMDNSPFCIIEKGTPTIATKAPFRPYEEYASDLFIDELYQFLDKRHGRGDTLRDGPYDLTIFNKSIHPDGDNTPFDEVFRLLKSTFMIPMNDRINIRYTLDMDYGVCLVLTSSGKPKKSLW